MEVAKTEKRASKPQKMKLKICKFPDCGEEFMGRGKAMYCEEHRKDKYRKVLYKKGDNGGCGIRNIHHSEVHSKRHTLTCGVEGCNCEYEVVLVPRLSEYPNYCEDHRNAYKRNTFIALQKKLAKENGDES